MKRKTVGFSLGGDDDSFKVGILKSLWEWMLNSSGTPAVPPTLTLETLRKDHLALLRKSSVILLPPILIRLQALISPDVKVSLKARFRNETAAIEKIEDYRWMFSDVHLGKPTQNLIKELKGTNNDKALLAACKVFMQAARQFVTELDRSNLGVANG